MPPLLQTYYDSKENLISSDADKVTTTQGPHKKKWELGKTGMSNGQLRTPSFKAHLTAKQSIQTHRQSFIFLPAA